MDIDKILSRLMIAGLIFLMFCGGMGVLINSTITPYELRGGVHAKLDRYLIRLMEAEKKAIIAEDRANFLKARVDVLSDVLEWGAR